MPLPLTEIYQKDAEQGAKITPPGMAHWAGSGPQGKFCKGCSFYSAKRCGKFQQMMRKRGGKIPGSTAACKYFEERPTHK